MIKFPATKEQILKLQETLAGRQLTETEIQVTEEAVEPLNAAHYLGLSGDEDVLAEWLDFLDALKAKHRKPAETRFLDTFQRLIRRAYNDGVAAKRLRTGVTS